MDDIVSLQLFHTIIIFYTNVLDELLVQKIYNNTHVLLYLFNLKNIYLDANIVDELVLYTEYDYIK